MNSEGGGESLKNFLSPDLQKIWAALPLVLDIFVPPFPLWLFAYR